MNRRWQPWTDQERMDAELERPEGSSAAIVARCATCNMSLCPDDTDCGTTGCTAERDIARADDWKRRALAAEERCAALGGHHLSTRISRGA